MKLFKSIIIWCSVGAAALSLTSCNDWLDVNTDPNNPSAESTAYELRLAHIEFYTNSGHSFADWRTGMQVGDWTRYYNGSTYWYSSFCYPVTGITTTPYQWWFVGAYCNVPDMYEKAMADENWYYAGAAKIIEAYGTMLMADLYGEMPFSDIASGSATPTYDTGRELFMAAIASVEEGIELFEKGAPAADKPQLATGDWWNNGDGSKWIKLGYFLKARWLNHLVKKESGSYQDGKYDADEILACLDKAMQSNADNTVIYHTDDNSTTHDVLGWDEPVDYSPLYSVCGMNAGYMPTKVLVDNLTNFGGYGVEDPRADKIIPWAYGVRDDNSDPELKWSGNWRRSKGVDMQSNINVSGGPLRAAYSTANGWYISSDSQERLGDTVYVEGTSSSKGYASNPDLLYRRAGKTVDASKESGTFYTRVSSPTYIGTYAEACFIRAEVLYKQGNRSSAYTAYQNGVRASIELMNEKLEAWVAEDATLADCPSFTPMEESDITNFINNGIGTQGELTLGHILTQKRIALLFDIEQWSDMRRYDFDPELFFGWGKATYHDYNVSATKATPNYEWRRWAQCSHEKNYNSANLQAIGASVPGAVTSDASGNTVVWYNQDDVWEIPVWWDSTQE